MSTAKDVADLIQLSIEEDVADISNPEGGEQRAWLEIVQGNRAYRIMVLQHEGVVGEDDIEPESADLDDDEMDGMSELSFDA